MERSANPNNVYNVKISHVNWFRAKLFQNVRPDPERHSDQLRISVCLVAWPEHHEGAGGAPGQGEDRTDKGDPLGRCWCAHAQHYHHLQKVRSCNGNNQIYYQVLLHQQCNMTFFEKIHKCINFQLNTGSFFDWFLYIVLRVGVERNCYL